MTFQVRTAAVADVPAMHRIRNDVRENRISGPRQISEACYLPYIGAGSAWVAETSTGIAGFAIIDAPVKRVWALFIDPNAEGLGIGRALHLRMLEWAEEYGIGKLTLSTGRGTRAEQFYRQAGWEEAGMTDTGETVFEIGT